MPDEVLSPEDSQPEEENEEVSEDTPDVPAEVEKAAAEGQWPPEGEVVKDERTLAMLVWLLGIFTGFIGPLVIYLMKKDDSKFVAFHALQCLFFGIAAMAFVMIIVMPLAFVTCGIGAILAFLPLVVSIVWLTKANKGEWAPLPVIGEYAKNIVFGKAE